MRPGETKEAARARRLRTAPSGPFSRNRDDYNDAAPTPCGVDSFIVPRLGPGASHVIRARLFRLHHRHGAVRHHGQVLRVGQRVDVLLPEHVLGQGRVEDVVRVRLALGLDALRLRLDLRGLLLGDILPRLWRRGFLLKNPSGFSIDRLSPHALWFARFMSRATR